MNKKAEMITGASVYVDGIGFISTAAKVELPKIEFESFDGKSGITNHKVATTILKAMEAKFELNEINPVYFAAMGARKTIPTVLWVKATTLKDGKDSKIVATLIGDISNFEFPNIELSKETTCKFTLSVDFFSYIQDDAPLLTIDVKNMICQIGANDLWAEQRDHLVG